MHTSFKISLRYLFAKKKRNAINIISSIAMLAFAVCTAALIIILSTMNGFEDLIFSMYNKFNPELKITLNERKVFEIETVKSKLKNIKDIKYAFTVLEDNAVARNGDYQTVCTIKGLDSTYFNTTGLNSRITEGLPTLYDKGINYAVIGAGVDQKINTNIEGIYNMISLITPKRADFTISDPTAITQLEIQPGGVITMDESINNRYIFVPLNFAQKLFEREGFASAYELTLLSNSDVESVKAQLKQVLGSKFKIQNRMQQQASLYKMFKSEKWASYAILTFILLIAAFNALGSLTMLVIEKKQDIATLNSMGANHQFIRSIFFTNGLLIAGIGSVIGITIGLLLVWAQQNYGLVKMQGALVENYPVKLILNDVILVAITAFGLGFLTGIYPAVKAGKGLI